MWIARVFFRYGARHEFTRDILIGGKVWNAHVIISFGVRCELRA